MNALLLDYLPVVIFIGVSLVIGSPFWWRRSSSPIRIRIRKRLSAYECGFNASMTPA